MLNVEFKQNPAFESGERGENAEKREIRQR
jgi:hypothetical protein